MIDRIWVLAALFAVLTAGFLARLVQLQIVEGERLAQAVDRSRLITEVLPPRRGRILDRHGTPLVDNREVYNLAVVFADLELTGRARREVPFYRLDEQRLGALVADLAVRLNRPPAPLRDILLKELLGHPGVAVRVGAQVRDANLVLVTMPRRSLAPTGGETDADLARLAEADLFFEDPREALERELGLRWGLAVDIITEAELRDAGDILDRDFNVTKGHCLAALEPFLPAFSVHLPTENPAGLDLALRFMEPDRRTQAETVLARLLDETPQLVHERLDRALAAARRPAPPSTVYFAPSAQAETIAPLLPEGQGLQEIRLANVPGVRERIIIIQGEPPETEGLFSQIQRHLAASLGTDGEWIGTLITHHGERIRAITCERDYRVHQLVLDPACLEHLCAGLAAELTRLGRPTTRLDVEQALASARAIADRAWEGQTRLDPIALFRDIPHPMAIRLAGQGGAPPSDLRRRYDDIDAPLPGLGIQVDLGREYPFPGSSSHLIGIIGRGADPEQPSAIATWQGRTGLEYLYDSVLRGVAGKRVRAHTPDGEVELPAQPPVAGSDLVTELDLELQTLAEDSLARWLELAKDLGTASEKMEKGAAAGKGRAGFVLIDCHTGGILACASSPGYQIDDLKTKYQELCAAPGMPLINHAVVAEQPPGSSMKICTALAGLENGVLQPGEKIHCLGYMAMVGGKKILRDHAPPGDYDLPRAIQISSNCYFATIAHRLGGEKLAAFAELVGLGGKSAIKVPDQSPGLLPRPSTIATFRPREPKWVPSDDWRMGIGQFLTASPLQVVVLGAAVANGGHIVRPFLVKPQSPLEVKDLHIRKAYLEEVRRGMELVTANEPGSTAKLLVLEGPAAGIKVAAKTGTAEWGRGEAAGDYDHAWMLGYAPADNPTVAFACFIHCGTFGGAACTPVVKRVLERYFTKYGRIGHALKDMPAE